MPCTRTFALAAGFPFADADLPLSGTDHVARLRSRKFTSGFHPQIDYARELNPQQLAAVTAPPGPALVIAGAGSGKTHTLTYRVAYLAGTGNFPADRILLLTFTNRPPVVAK